MLISRHILAGSLAVAAVTAGAVSLGAGPAAAESCPSGATCAYTTTNWASAAGPVTGNNTNLTQFSKWTGAESIYNNGTSCNVYIYSSTGYHGTRYALNRGTGWKTIAGSDIWHHAYSNQWYGC